jgi:hypothetical protein
MFSVLSSGVTRATYFDQAARNVACIAEVLFRAKREPAKMGVLGFFVLAPDEQISGAVAELVGIRVGVVSGVMNLESSGVEASDWRPRHDQGYHQV